jgi:hypothetical protein
MHFQGKEISHKESDMAEQLNPKEVEDGFRNTLEDVRDVLLKLAPYCLSVEEVAGVVDLGTKNDAQLRLLYTQIMGKNDPSPSGNRVGLRLPK